ncbi:hypothetical protein Cgig2_030939 [Carnegiea gigantea]|uniref:Uncharacterized protein n=1 Tax=Carnegiea gigantea TaxID=171969 RepID=A0A9Q1GIQ8_9CARY|nr:hypothetical protein Cgig2_030939 [Carnegiea gigantea]
MAVMKPGLLLKQYHPKSLVSLGALWIHLPRGLRRHTRHAEGTASRWSSSLTKGRPSGQGSDCPDQNANPSGNSDPSATISATNPSSARPFLLSTDLPGAYGLLREEGLVDAPSEDELLDELSEEELEEASPEVELELVGATSAPGLDEDRAEQGLPCIPSASSSSGDLMRGGYVTSTSGLRTLGVEEYSQRDHEGVSGSKRGTA